VLSAVRHEALSYLAGFVRLDGWHGFLCLLGPALCGSIDSLQHNVHNATAGGADRLHFRACVLPDRVCPRRSAPGALRLDHCPSSRSRRDAGRGPLPR
jgi:hypothetical protein